MLNHTCRMRLLFSISVLIAVSATGLSGERSLAQNSEPEHGAATAPSMFSNPSLDSYKMDLLVSPNESSIKGTVLLRYRNNSSQALSAIRLRLDPNLNPKQSLEITGVSDEVNKPLPWTYRPLKFANWSSDKGAMEVTLDRPLAKSAETTIKLEFHSTGNHLTPDMVILQDDPFQSLDGWYPKAMSYRDDGWSLDDDRPADYSATVRLPANYVLASSGHIEIKGDQDGDRQVLLKAEHLRGFTILASPNWKRLEHKTGTVELAICLPPEAEQWAGEFRDRRRCDCIL